jgi:hypothetical protein
MEQGPEEVSDRADERAEELERKTGGPLGEQEDRGAGRAHDGPEAGRGDNDVDEDAGEDDGDEELTRIDPGL